MGGGQVKYGEPNRTQTPQMGRDKYDKTVIDQYSHGVFTMAVIASDVDVSGGRRATVNLAFICQCSR